MRPINWPDIDFSEFAIGCDNVIHKPDAHEHICNLVFSLIDFFTHDPHPAIRTNAAKARSSFQKLAQIGRSKSASGSSHSGHSASPPFGSLQTPPRSATPPPSRDDSSDSTPSDDSLFESDSNALTSIFLRDLVTSKGYGRPLRPPPSPPGAQNFGAIAIPGAHLQLRNVNRQVRGTPTHLAYDNSNQSIAMATSQGCVYFLDENLGSSQQLHLPDSDISDLHWFDFGGASYVVACTADGCAHLWAPGTARPAASWRADANYLCGSLPQLCAVAPHYPAIVTARGNGGIALWDLVTQQLAGEWNFREPNIISALCLRPENPKIAAAGYSNGAIAEVDMRISGLDDASKFWYVNIGDKVVRIRDNRNGRERMYAASSSGKVVIWDAETHGLDPSLNLRMGVAHFDLHSALPIAAFTRQKEHPLLCRCTDAVPLCTAGGVDAASIFAFHQILPMITFALPNGQLISYDIALAPEQK
jgi:hypothetical protein